MRNKELINECDERIKSLAKFLEEDALKMGSELIITSGKRNGDGRSWHDKGLAIDFNYKDIHSFKIVSNLFKLYMSDYVVFKGATEFEVVSQDKIKHHIHIAFGTEKQKDIFTGVYK